MQLQQGDILVKKSKGQPIYWLSERLVVEVCGVDNSYLERRARYGYKKSVSKAKQINEFLPDTGKSWRYAKTKHGFYYCYDNIPDRKPTYYKSKFGTENDIKEALNQLKTTSKTELKEVIKQDIQQIIQRSICNIATRYYRFDADVPFNEQKAKELSEALTWCKFLKLHYNNESFKQFGIHQKQQFLEVCAEILQAKQLEGLKVKSSAYLRNKINSFPTVNELDQYNYLISDRYNNDNARIVGKYQLYDEDTAEVFKFDAHQALMFYGYMNPGYSGKQAGRQIYINFYTPAIKEFGFEPVAYRTFTHHMSSLHNRIKSARERHGKDYYKKQVQTYVPSEKLQYAHSLFAGDGSGTISYKYVNSKGKLSTMKLYVIMISDVASRKIVGWSPAPKGEHKESSEMTQNAVKMALENCNYQTMFELVTDNHSAFTSAESKNFLNLVFNKVRTIEVGNSQANPAETEFRLFKQSLKGLSNFASTSWKIGIEGESNADYFNIEDLPTYEEAILQFYDVVKAWNEAQLRDGTTPNERFEVKHPKLAPIEPKVIRQINGNHTQVDISYMRGFVQVSKTKGYDYRDAYLFEIPDYWDTGAELISKACGYKKFAKVKVVWTTEMADLYTLDGKFIMSCPPAQKASQSHAETTDANANALEHHLKRKKQQTEALDEFEESLQEVFDALPYAHEVATGGSKETYNGKMLANEESKILTKTEIAKRDFDKSEDFNKPL